MSDVVESAKHLEVMTTQFYIRTWDGEFVPSNLPSRALAAETAARVEADDAREAHFKCATALIEAAEARALAAEAKVQEMGKALLESVPALSEVPAPVVVAMGKRLGVSEPFNETSDDDLAAMFIDGLREFIRARAALQPKEQT
jgi:hypothetical protein